MNGQARWGDQDRDELDDDCELIRWGLRFKAATVEAAYHEWHRGHAVHFTRAGAILALLAWSLGLIIMAIAVPDRAAESILWILFGALPIISITLAASYVSRLVGVVQPLTALSNVCSGFVAVGLSYRVGHPPLAMGGAALVSYFAFIIFRLRPLHAGIAAFPYIALNHALVLQTEMSPAESAYVLLIPWLAFITGLSACALIDRMSRATFRQERIIDVQQKSIARERERAERLLYSILPVTVAERLKQAPVVIADRFDEVTVLFADIVGFTPLAARESPERIVEILNDIFTRFDRLAELHSVEKVKTIGDAYMAVAGLPTPIPEHAKAAAEMALAMHAAVEEVGRQHGQSLSLRIGLCSGPVVAGVIGVRRFAYDLWGDTVNTAARMEASGVAGATQVCESTYDRIRERFELEERGVIEVKGKGPMRTWLLTRGDHTTIRQSSHHLS